jgi:diguanylate cyclase (GGDEF)-like protein
MPSKKNRCGTLFCLFSLPILAGLYYLIPAVPPGFQPIVFSKIVPLIGLVASCFALFFGNFSYPRLHSAKLFFLGYGIGLTGIAYFAFCKPFIALKLPPVPAGFAELLIIVSLVNLIVAALIPAETKYRTTRSVTLSAITVEAVLCAIFRFTPGTWLNAFLSTSPLYPVFWVGPFLFLSALLLSLWKIRREFFLGGVVAGCAVLFAAAWVCTLLVPAHAAALRLLILAAAPFSLSIGMVVHGFMRMEHRISYDPLLQIYNRDYCSKIISEQANLNMAPPFGVAMVDIDHFKNVNDTYGHHAGDCVLHAVAQAVQRGAGAGIACRYGGEELAIFFPQKATPEVTAILEKIRSDIEKIKTRAGKKTISVTVSAGVSHRELFSQPIADVIKAADKALYTAKKKGRNQVRSQKLSS